MSTPDTHFAGFVNVPVFAGQGTTAASSSQTRRQALRDADLASGNLLLSSCYQAFLAELAALSQSELDQTDINPADFGTAQSLLSVTSRRYERNPVISGTTLFLVQSLRYLAHVESSAATKQSGSPFVNSLQRNALCRLGVLGFSSGILPACVVATSTTTISYVSNAVEGYRLAFWIGVRCQLYRTSALRTNGASDSDSMLPWSLVFLGTGRIAAEEMLAAFHTKNPDAPLLHVTAVMDNTCVTISGRPDVLAQFSAEVPVGSSIHMTTIDTLYHAQVHMDSTRDEVLADVTRRNLRFPNFTDIIAPVRSTWTGELIDCNGAVQTACGSLVEAVVDMILTQPVNWDEVIKALVQTTPCGSRVCLINVGPGTGLTHSMERAFQKDLVVSIDLTSQAETTKGDVPSSKQEPIAIVGMAVNMPGAPNTSQLWEVLEKGINTISEIPEHRFRITEYNKDNPKTNRQMKARSGNFLTDPDEFDHRFFNISPREAKSMDPQQRLLLHVAYEALENAGYVPDSTPTFHRDAFGCYVGVATHDYFQNLREEIDVYYSTGMLRAFLSGRISYAMQWSGPSVVVDTACSSSLVAIYQACRALMNRDCNAALAGGVNVMTSPDMFIGLDRGHFLSPAGQCKSFDAAANGYSRSEGCGVFVLKRLSDAITENDTIMGVIRGVDVNQSGLAHSITHPHAPTQANLFRRVLQQSSLDPRRVNVVEAHGAGTQSGDPNELESIRSVLAVGRPSENPLHITSIKANIGHMEAASGAASLAKLLLMLRHRIIPPQISLNNLNPRIRPLESDNTIIDRVCDVWQPSHPGLPRIAMLNNFGAAGSNGTLLLEEFVSQSPAAGHPPGLTYIFGLSAKTRVALDDLRTKYVHWLQDPSTEQVRFADIAYTCTARRIVYPHRLAVTARDRRELIEKLSKVNTTEFSLESKPCKVVFVFSGQGSQYLAMGASLYHTCPVFRRHIDECHSTLRSAGFPGVLQIITADSTETGLSMLEEFVAFQTSIFSLEYSLAKVWMSWGIHPDAVVGHSLGEYAALVIADVVAFEDALIIIAHRARLMIQKCAAGRSGMVAINQTPDEVKGILRSSNTFSDISIACYNSEVDCVVAGPVDQLKALKKHLDNEVHCKSVDLAVPFGYHSSAMYPLLEDLTLVTKHVSLRPPKMPVLSNVFGSVLCPEDSSVLTPEYFARHCVEPVRFERGITALCSLEQLSDVAAWIELGPHTTTLSMLKSNSSVSKNARLLGSIRKDQDPWTTLSTSLSQLYTSNIAVLWREVFAHVPSVTCIDMPSYPFSMTKFWVDSNEEASTEITETDKTTAPAVQTSEFAMLHAWAQFPSIINDNVAVFETPISMLSKFIQGHSVGGIPLCPASVYLEQILAGIELSQRYLGLSNPDNHALIRDVEFAKPLVYAEGVACFVKTTIKLFVQDGSGTFQVSSYVDTANELAHVYGSFRLRPAIKTLRKLSHVTPILHRQMGSLASPATEGSLCEIFSTRTAYKLIFPRVVDYAKEYHTMQSLTIDSSGMEGYAVVKLPADHDLGKFVVHPVFMDTLLHVAGFVANMQGGVNDAYMCSRIEGVKLVPDLVDNHASYGVFCRNAWLADEGVMLADTYAVELSGSKRTIAHLKAVHFRRVRLDSLQKGLKLAKCHISAPLAHPPFSRLKVPVLESASQCNGFAGVQAAVMRILATTCNIDASTLNLDTDLTCLGVDSLMSIEILYKLQATFPRAVLNSQAISLCRIPADIIQVVSSGYCDDNSGLSSSRTLVPGEPLPESGFRSGDQVPQALCNKLRVDLPSNFFTISAMPCAPQPHVIECLHGKAKAAQVTAAEVVDTAQSTFGSLTKALYLGSLPDPLQTAKTNDNSPLFLIHDGSGLINYYERLSPLGRNVWGIHNPHFITGREFADMSSMATEYAEYVSQTVSGPVLLGGWSFGGVAAFETARQLLKKGTNVKGVVLIDSPNPVEHIPLKISLVDSVVNFGTRGAGSEIRGHMMAQFQKNSVLLSKYDPLASGEPFPPLLFLRCREGFKPSGLSEPVPTWLADRDNPSQTVAGWESLVGKTVKILDIPGHHFQPFHNSNVHEVSRRIADACVYLDCL